MARFAFRLQKVLEHRQRIEDDNKILFAKSRQVYLSEKEKLQMLYKKLEESRTDKVEKSTGIFTYIAKYNYMLLLEKRIEEQTKRVKACENDMLIKKNKLEESRKSRKVIDKLKENTYKQYMRNMERLEQKQNDEFALYGYMRNS